MKQELHSADPGVRSGERRAALDEKSACYKEPGLSRQDKIAANAGRARVSSRQWQLPGCRFAIVI